MTIAISVEESRLRRRIRHAADAIPEWSWTVDELRKFAELLESIVESRRRIDLVGNVAWLADHRS